MDLRGECQCGGRLMDGMVESVEANDLSRSVRINNRLSLTRHPNIHPSILFPRRTPSTLLTPRSPRPASPAHCTPRARAPRLTSLPTRAPPNNRHGTNPRALWRRVRPARGAPLPARRVPRSALPLLLGDSGRAQAHPPDHPHGGHSRAGAPPSFQTNSRRAARRSARASGSSCSRSTTSAPRTTSATSAWGPAPSP
jgi:hypothetical protein